MIIIEHSKTLTQPYKVRYAKGEKEFLAESKPLKSKKACWRNIYDTIFLFYSSIHYIIIDGWGIEVKDTTVPNPEVFVYDINGIKKKAGVRK